MTDYFALLDQPRRAWLDPAELKQAFHAKSLQLHPDAQAGEAGDTAFTALNEAHQVLQDPKRRIHHLLTLEGCTPRRDGSVPDDIADLFPTVAQATQQVDAVAQKFENATTPLSRSLLKPQVLVAQTRLNETLARLEKLKGDALAEAQRCSTTDTLEEDDWAALHRLYVRFSYLGRWIAELQEKQQRLAHT